MLALAAVVWATTLNTGEDSETADAAQRAAYRDRAQVAVALWVTIPVTVLLLGVWYVFPQVGGWHEDVLNWIIDRVQWVVATFHLA